MANSNIGQFFIFAGEPSGDLHASHVIRSLRPLLPTAQMMGVGGPLMRQAGIQQFLPMEEFLVMGITDVIFALPKLRRNFYKVLQFILEKQPEGVLFVDYPGFNLRMAAALRKRGYKGKLIHYISPMVWVHGAKRIQKMEKNLDLLLLIYPFEQSYYEKSSLTTHYVGNPLVEYLQLYPYSPQNLGPLAEIPSRQLVGVFPGSRKSEIQRNLSKILQSVKELKKQHPLLQFAIPLAHDHLRIPIAEQVELAGLQLGKDLHLRPQESIYDLMSRCHLALATSGTVTLELCLHRVPTVIVYDLSFLNAWIAHYVMKVDLPFYGLPNILANRQVFPELIYKQFTSEQLTLHATRLLKDGPERTSCLEGCEHVISQLQQNQASHEVAKSIAHLLHS